MPTVHSERLGVELHLGKNPASKLAPGSAKYGELRPALARAGLLPKTPAMFGHGHDFPQGKWLMLGNGPDDTVFPGFGGCGDCAWAGPAHEEMEAAKNAGRPVPRFSGETVVAQYSEYSGYDARTGANDNGANVQDVIAWRQERGLRDDQGNLYKIGREVWLEPGNLQHLWEATWLFENVGIGIEVAAAQMRQFDAGPQPTWDYVAGSPIEGGHYVPVMGKLGLISWAEDVYYTPRFIEKQMDEGVVYLDNERYNRVTGETLEHFKDADLEKFVVLVAQQKLGVV